MIRSISYAVSLALALSSPAEAGDAATDASAFAETLRAELGVPGLSFVATDADRTIAWGVAGVRSIDTEEPVRRTDPFHIGSLTKSMTATVAARLVERGRIDWETTIEQASPRLAEQIPERARSITLRQLLSHRAGLPDDRLSGPMQIKLWSLQGPLTDQRLEASKAFLNAPSATAPGEQWTYCNAGYIIAGHLLESATDTHWEDLIRQELFEPLGMTTAGQGPPGMDDPQGGYPVGHGRGTEGYNPVPAQIGADNPPVLGPAGRVHCSMDDLARYARAHLGGLQGRAGLLEPATFELLHADPEADHYALGWGVSGEGDDRRSAHSGSNTRWLALISIHPGRNLAIAVGMNAMPDQDRQIDILGRILTFLSRERKPEEQP